MSTQNAHKDQAYILGATLATGGNIIEAAEHFVHGYAATQSRDERHRHRLALVGIDALIKAAEDVRRWLVDDARQGGLSWSEIGEALEISKQAAQQRYGSQS